MVTDHPIGKADQTVLFPALAIPVQTKSEYECPPEHLDVLRTCIPEVSKLLVIGWRATEDRFLKLLTENLQQRPRVMVVAGSQEGTEQPIERLQRAGIGVEFLRASGGFTDLIVRREADEFLRD